MKKIPFFPLLFALYPILALYAFNQREVGLDVLARPLGAALLAAALVTLLLRLVLRSWSKAALGTTILVFLFFSYGHLYNILKTDLGFLAGLARHRYLLPLYGLIALTAFYFIIRRRAPGRDLVQFFNLAGLVLTILMIGQIIYTNLSNRGETDKAQQALPFQPLKVDAAQKMPDVYYIVLDGYTRSDALLRDFNFDNSPFIDQLTRLGFYVVPCSRPNYTYTLGSVTSTLNMDYVQPLETDLAKIGITNNPWVALLKSRVRLSLESIGYKTVGFQTDYRWSEMRDADIYLAPAGTAYSLQTLTPFEAMLLKTTAYRAVSDDQVRANLQQLETINHLFLAHINTQKFLLSQLPKVAGNPAPTFTFAHILIPHRPYVFAADGTILTDPGYFGGENDEPIDEEYTRKGYVGEIQFINTQISAILSEIFAQSKTPPVIVIMGDHGLREPNRGENLLAVYLPGNHPDAFYASLTPVNVFRIVFNRVFGTTYDLLPDVTYKDESDTVILPEPACTP